jgi:dTDP-4-dehydrorhamnose 3,5-epimerase
MVVVADGGCRGFVSRRGGEEGLVTFAGFPGVIASKLEVYSDERGSFAEIARASAFPATFVQSNHSHSRAGVLRGLHYHRNQADLWYVVGGIAQVALVDLRTRLDPPTVVTGRLSADEPLTLYVPPGVAHGYLAVTDLDVVYWHTQYYDPSDEHGLAWDDPALRIPWESASPVLSEKDSRNKELRWDEIPQFT